MRVLRIAAVVEVATLVALLVNLATVHWAPVASMLGPTHGCAYLAVIGATWQMTKAGRIACSPSCRGSAACSWVRKAARLRHRSGHCEDMRIGIIGAGHIGGNLAQLFVRHGHDVVIANSRGPQTLTEVSARTGATAVPLTEAPRDADVVVVAVPLKAIGELPKGLLDSAKPGAAVVDTNNYYPQRDGPIRPLEDGGISARWVQEQLGRPTVKVFNNIVAQELLDRPQPTGTDGRRALPVAGDDEAIKAVVLSLVDEIGFDALDIGSLNESWRYQPGTPAYGTDVDAAELIELLNEADPDAA
jgi:predicted dinucleotide-binding enzyme